MTPLVAAVLQRAVHRAGFSGALDIAQMGSGAGFEMFCTENKADVVMASRAMTPSERQTCSAIGRNPVSLAVRIDALAIVVSADNSFVKDVTLQELKEIFTADYWSDVAQIGLKSLFVEPCPSLDLVRCNCFQAKL